ncbi:MAG: rod shape-determining protein, partial [Clostridia bacterium]|nr:rod shape-determining protein [Clostridia bacterium]
NLAVGERTSENIKIDLGAAHFNNSEEASERKVQTFDARGRDLLTGLPKTITISAPEIAEALQDQVEGILGAIKACLENTPPELAADIMDRGIVMAGGGSLLFGLDGLVSEETGMPVHIAENPLSAIVVGAGKVLDNINLLKRVDISSK